MANDVDLDLHEYTFGDKYINLYIHSYSAYSRNKTKSTRQSRKEGEIEKSRSREDLDIFLGRKPMSRLKARGRVNAYNIIQEIEKLLWSVKRRYRDFIGAANLARHLIAFERRT